MEFALCSSRAPAGVRPATSAGARELLQRRAGPVARPQAAVLRRQLTVCESSSGASTSSSSTDPPPVKKLSKAAKQRIEREGPRVKDIKRDLDGRGVVYREALAARADRSEPRWGALPALDPVALWQALKAGQVKRADVWEDQPPSPLNPLHRRWEGKRCVIELTDGRVVRCTLDAAPLATEISEGLLAAPRVDLAWHKLSTGVDPAELRMGALTAAGAAFVIASIWLGFVRKHKMPIDLLTAMEFAQSRAGARREGRTGVVFADVAGLGPTLGELQEVVAYLKDPTRFTAVGARPIKGMLLEGGPGTGKTLLAKAIAGEAGVPFYALSGSEFVELIVGVGAARVRDLFKRARANAPCIVFVDEIDALGMARGPASMKGAEERDQTLNQLLTEMDGFAAEAGVIFMGATNRADMLDPALLRPGRFDRVVRVPKPSTSARAAILAVHAAKTPLEPAVDLQQLARDLPGFSGAELANVLNEAALGAIRRGSATVGPVDVRAAVQRVVQGAPRPALGRTLPTTRVLAVHEAGHALVAATLRAETGRLEPVDRVSIEPRGDELTRTLFVRATDEAYALPPRARLLERLQQLLAGRAAEEEVYGMPSTHAAGDLQDATALARRLVITYSLGQPDVVSTYVDPPAFPTLTVFDKGRAWAGKAEDLAAGAAGEEAVTEGYRHVQPSQASMDVALGTVQRLLSEADAAACARLRRHRAALDAITEALLKQGELTGTQLEAIIADHPPGPVDAAEREGDRRVQVLRAAEAGF